MWTRVPTHAEARVGHVCLPVTRPYSFESANELEAFVWTRVPTCPSCGGQNRTLGVFQSYFLIALSLLMNWKLAILADVGGCELSASTYLYHPVLGL